MPASTSDAEHDAHPTAPIVVGVDGSVESTAALDWAADEATLRRHPLHIVHAFLWPLTGMYLGPSPEGPHDAGLEADAKALLVQSIQRVAATHPDLPVTTALVVAGAAPTLIDQSRRAALVIVGCRGLGGFAGMLVGSVSVQLAAHTHCTAVAVRGGPSRTLVDDPAGRQIVVGTDGSEGAEAAVGFGFEEASLRNCGLTALLAWPVSGRGRRHHPGDEEPGAGTDRILAESIAGWVEKFPTVPVRRLVVHSPAAKALVDESTRADLLVVGARGHGGFSGLRLGSASQAALHHAACPVAVVHRAD